MRIRRTTTCAKQYKHRHLIEWNNLPAELLLTVTDYLNVSNKLMIASTCKSIQSQLIPNIPQVDGTYVSRQVYTALQSIQPGIVITDNIDLVIRYLRIRDTLLCSQTNWSKSDRYDYARYKRVIIIDGEELLLSETPIDPYNNIVSQCDDTYILLQTDIYDKQINCPVSYVYFRDYKPKIDIKKFLFNINSSHNIILSLLPEHLAITFALSAIRININHQEAIITHTGIRHGKNTVKNLSQLGRSASTNILHKLIVCKYIDDLNELKRILAIRCKSLMFVVYDRGNYINELQQLIDIVL